MPRATAAALIAVAALAAGVFAATVWQRRSAPHVTAATSALTTTLAVDTFDVREPAPRSWTAASLAESLAVQLRHTPGLTVHRAPEQAGYDFWVSAVKAGYSRADLLAEFAESAENVAQVAAIIGNGFAYTPYTGS